MVDRDALKDAYRLMREIAKRPLIEDIEDQDRLTPTKDDQRVLHDPLTLETDVDEESKGE